MHRSETEQLAACSVCGGDVSPRDRPFAFGDEQLLCFECASARRGVYDEAHDRWVLAPYVADLLPQTIESM